MGITSVQLQAWWPLVSGPLWLPVVWRSHIKRSQSPAVYWPKCLPLSCNVHGRIDGTRVISSQLHHLSLYHSRGPFTPCPYYLWGHMDLNEPLIHDKSVFQLRQRHNIVKVAVIQKKKSPFILPYIHTLILPTPSSHPSQPKRETFSHN